MRTRKQIEEEINLRVEGMNMYSPREKLYIEVLLDCRDLLIQQNEPKLPFPHNIIDASKEAICAHRDDGSGQCMKCYKKLH